MKILYTIGVVIGWLIAMQINLMGAAKDANKVSGRNLFITTIGFALVATGIAVFGLFKIWR